MTDFEQYVITELKEIRKDIANIEKLLAFQKGKITVIVAVITIAVTLGINYLIKLL